MTHWQVIVGDVTERMAELDSNSVHCVVTSPPYWGLRRYEGLDGVMGLEPTIHDYVLSLVKLFREVRRVMTPDASLWLNLGDAYAGSQRGVGGPHGKKQRTNKGSVELAPSGVPEGLKPKDLMGLPWRVAFALQADGWWLRDDIIWHKVGAMAESVRDRPVRAHEYIFLMSPSKNYYFDHVAIRTPLADSSIARMSQPNFWQQKGGPKDYAGGVNPNRSARGMVENLAAREQHPGHGDFNPRAAKRKETQWGGGARTEINATGANLRDVWSIPITHLRAREGEVQHHAVFPKELVTRCVLAGTSVHGVCSECGRQWERVLNHKMKEDDFADGEVAEDGAGYFLPRCDCQAGTVPAVVMDPFSGSGTTGLVALRLGRSYVGVELNPDYAESSRRRIREDMPLLNIASERTHANIREG